MAFSVIIRCSSALPRSSSPSPCFVPRSSVSFMFDHSHLKPISIRPSTSISAYTSGRGDGEESRRAAECDAFKKLKSGAGHKRPGSVSSDEPKPKKGKPSPPSEDTGSGRHRPHRQPSSGASSKPHNPPSISEVVARDLSDGLVAEGRVYEMKPEGSKRIENYLQLMSKMNPKLQFRLEKFISAAILLVNELTNEDKPPPSH